MTLRSARIQQCPANSLPQGGRGLRRRCAFTLTELLVVMGVIAVLATLTLVSVRAITDNARLSSATNTVMAALDNARALAMKKNKPVMVAFIPRLVGPNEVQVESVTAEWSGTVIFQPVDFGFGAEDRVFERFVPINDIGSRQLPRGISVAGPSYSIDSLNDTVWFAASNLASLQEAPGRVVGVMYAPDGTRHTNNPATATLANNYQFIDFNNNGDQDRSVTSSDVETYFLQLDPADEPCIELLPFLAVFDDDAAREMFGDDDWDIASTREEELTQYITQFADRIHFNRYTGVAMK